MQKHNQICCALSFIYYWFILLLLFLLLLHVLYWLTYYYHTFPFGRKSALLRMPALCVTSLLWSTPLTYTYTSWSTQWNKLIFIALIFRLYSVDCNRPGTRHRLVWPKLFAVVILLLLHLLPMHGVMYQDRIDWDQWNKLPRKTNSRFSGHMTETIWVQCFSGAKTSVLRQWKEMGSHGG